MVQMPDNLSSFEKLSYIDRVQFWIPRQLLRHEKRQLELLCPGGIHVHRKPMAFHPQWKCRIQLNQPGRYALLFLDEMLQGENYLINYLEVSLDFISSSKRQVKRLRRVIDSTLVMPESIAKANGRRFRRPPLYYNNSTLYFYPRDAPNNVTIYSDKPSKIKDRPCVHIEWRIRTKGALKKLGIVKPAHLANLDLLSFWQRRLRFERIFFRPFKYSQMYLKNTPTPGIKPLVCTRKRIEGMIRRYCATSEERGAIAQSIREWGRKVFWFPLGDFVRVLLTEEFLPRTGEIACVRGPKGKKGIRTRPLSKNAREPLLSDELWELIRLFIPKPPNTHKFGGGRPRRSNRHCMRGILYVATGRGGWDDLNKLEICPSSTAHDRMKEWRDADVFRIMKQHRLDEHPDLTSVNWSILGAD